MRVLFLHVDYLEYEVKEKALKGVPDVPQSKRHGRIEEALVCFISAEKGTRPIRPATAGRPPGKSPTAPANRPPSQTVSNPIPHLSPSPPPPGPAQNRLPPLE